MSVRQPHPVSSGGGAGTPGGSTTQVQYNNAGAFGGISGATTDGTTLTLVAPVLGAATGTSLALSGAIGQLGGSAGVSLSAAAGILTITDLGNTNESLTLNLSGSNSAAISTGTGVNVLTILNATQIRSSSSGSTGISYSQTISGGGFGLGGTITNSSSTTSGVTIGVVGTATKSSTTGGDSLTVIGVRGIGVYSSTGTQVDAIGVYGRVDKTTSGSGSITNAYSVYGDLPVASGGGTITNSWSLYGNGPLGLAGKCARYNAIDTVSNGIPSEYATVDLTGQTAAIVATTAYAVPASGLGMYRVSWVATITTAASSSSILGGTNGFQIKYTDGNDSVVKTSVAGNSITSAANTTGTSVSGCLIAYCLASSNLQYLFDYTSVGGTPMAYNLHIKVEAL